MSMYMIKPWYSRNESTYTTSTSWTKSETVAQTASRVYLTDYNFRFFAQSETRTRSLDSKQTITDSLTLRNSITNRKYLYVNVMDTNGNNILSRSRTCPIKDAVYSYTAFVGKASSVIGVLNTTSTTKSYSVTYTVPKNTNSTSQAYEWRNISVIDNFQFDDVMTWETQTTREITGTLTDNNSYTAQKMVSNFVFNTTGNVSSQTATASYNYTSVDSQLISQLTMTTYSETDALIACYTESNYYTYSGTTTTSRR